MKEPITTEKVTDASLTKSIISSVIGIVLCMACLFGTTWAWYSSSVTSGVSVTVGANFDFDIEITKTGETTALINPDAESVYNLNGGEHTVTVKKTGTAKKGFCQIIATKADAEAGTTYYIVNFLENAGDYVTFSVKGSGTLKLTPMWGTPTSEYTAIPSEGITLKPDSVAMTSPPKTEIQPDKTVPPTDGETGTSEGNTTEGGQIPPDAGETPSGGTSANPEQTEPETQTEPISEIPPETTTQE